MRFTDLYHLVTEASILDQTPGSVQAPAPMTKRVVPPIGLREKQVIYVTKENSTPGSSMWVPPYKMYELLKSGVMPPSSRPKPHDIPKTVHNREPSAKELMKLTKAKWEVARRVPLLGKILKKMPTVLVDGNSRYQTMAVRTDGILLININFLNTISFEETVGVLAHEAMHILFKHLNRLKSRDMYHSNIATDSVINYSLLKDKEFKLPEGGFMPTENYGNISPTFNYNFLVVKHPPQKLLPNQPDLMCYYVDVTASAEDTWEKMYDDIMYSLKEEKRITYCIGEILNIRGTDIIITDLKEHDAAPTQYTYVSVPPELREELGI